MRKPTPSPVNLGQVQANLQTATSNLRLATRAKAKADAEYLAALEFHERQRREFHTALVVVQTASRVPDPYAA